MPFTRQSRGVVWGPGVEISVSHTGVGIAPEDQEAVFEEGIGTIKATSAGLPASSQSGLPHEPRRWARNGCGIGLGDRPVSENGRLCRADGHGATAAEGASRVLVLAIL